MEISYANRALRDLCLGPSVGLLTLEATEALHAVLADLRAARRLDDAPRSYRTSGSEVVIPVGRTGWEVVATFEHIAGASAVMAGRVKIIGVRKVSE